MSHRAGSGPDSALFTDLYELRMARSYFERGMLGQAVFDLSVRSLPRERNYLVAAGLDDALRYLEDFSFSDAALQQLAEMGEFPDEIVEQFGATRFTGDVYAVPEGTPLFAGEPIIEVIAPLPEAQLVETYLLNQIHFQTAIASKGARIVEAAAGRSVADFGARRAHGTDAAIKAARALYIAGVGATSNVLASRRYGIPAAGTMAHSYVQAHDHELDAFRNFVASYPDTTLLVDTYDTTEGIRNVIRLAGELGNAFAVSAIRLDSGDLRQHAREARTMLDAAGLTAVQIIASGGLDEHSIAALVVAGAPIDGFGVGTKMDVPADAPTLDAVYKLVAYEGEGRAKLSPGKETLPGCKQVFRESEGGMITRDVLALRDEQSGGTPLLGPVMRAGHRLLPTVSLAEARGYAERQRDTLAPELRAIERAAVAFPIEVSPQLGAEHARVTGLMR
ncbi:MAG TPA: nicotinate phosphoribosyltransferase [Dehalococcoidia bacterium]|nr:nicotinate phosphoribosyltransferase [Dehalococcoidia bacterium]